MQLTLTLVRSEERHQSLDYEEQKNVLWLKIHWAEYSHVIGVR
jgi:hypothetical protein